MEFSKESSADYCEHILQNILDRKEHQRRNKMSVLQLEVEPLAGSTMKQCIEYSHDLCIKLNLAYVKFNFNGAKVSVGRNCNLEESLKEWESKCGCKVDYYCFN